MNSRQQTILQMAVDQDQVSVTSLAKAIGASEVTIRQDLNTLEKLSYLRRAHGFTVSLDSGGVGTHMMSNYTLEREPAKFATSLVQPGETIFIENGSNNALLARTLGEQKRNVTVIIVSSYIAHLLKDAPYEVILLGGVYQKKSESMVGPLARQYIQQVHFSRAFVGIGGWQPEAGFTGHDMMRIDVVNTMPEEKCEAIVLTDNPKFGAVHSYSVGPVERLNRVITDSKIRASNLIHLEYSKLTIHVVDV